MEEQLTLMDYIVSIGIIVLFFGVIFVAFYIDKKTNDFCNERGYPTGESGSLFGSNKTIVCCTNPEYQCQVYVKRIEWIEVRK